MEPLSKKMRITLIGVLLALIVPFSWTKNHRPKIVSTSISATVQQKVKKDSTLNDAMDNKLGRMVPDSLFMAKPNHKMPDDKSRTEMKRFDDNRSFYKPKLGIMKTGEIILDNEPVAVGALRKVYLEHKAQYQDTTGIDKHSKAGRKYSEAFQAVFWHESFHFDEGVTFGQLYTIQAEIPELLDECGIILPKGHNRVERYCDYLHSTVDKK